MMKILCFFSTLFVAVFTVIAIEDFGEETTMASSFPDMNPNEILDTQSAPTNPDQTMKPPSILNSLEQAAWKIVEFEWNVTSAIQKKLDSSLAKVIGMRSEAEPVLTRIIGLLGGGALSSDIKTRK